MNQSQRESETIEVKGCARCGKDHPVEFFEFSNDPILRQDGTSYERWGICPNTGDPILMYAANIPYDDDAARKLVDVFGGSIHINPDYGYRIPIRLMAGSLQVKAGALLVFHKAGGGFQAYVQGSDEESAVEDDPVIAVMTVTSNLKIASVGIASETPNHKNSKALMTALKPFAAMGDILLNSPSIRPDFGRDDKEIYSLDDAVLRRRDFINAYKAMNNSVE